MADMLGKSKTLGWEACPCRQCRSRADDHRWRRIARRRESRAWKAEMRPDWDTYFLGVAAAVAARADCTRRQVGAVVVDTGNRVLSVGYNGAPPGVPGCASAGACPRGKHMRNYSLWSYCTCGVEWPCPDAVPSGKGDYDHCVSVHAEANALLYSDPVRRIGGTLYCTDEPCPGCRKLIEGAGIARVVVA